MPDPVRKTFARWVHDACSHLYDSHYLQNHPLGSLLTPAYAESNGFQRSQLLRRILLDAIQSLRPQPKTPAQSQDWRLYSLLELRYLERLSPKEAMQQLSLSKSQFFRDQAQALELVTDLLWRQVHAPEEAIRAMQGQRSPVVNIGAVDVEDADAQVAFPETTWHLIHLAELLEDLLPIVQPLADRHRTVVEVHSLYDLPPVRSDRVMLRQVLLNVLTYAITSTTTQKVVVHGASELSQTMLSFHFGLDTEKDTTGESTSAQGSRLTLAAQIMESLGGVLSEQRQLEAQTIILRWSATRQKTLLMIDDNQGLVELFRRYLTGEPWQIIWAKSGGEARQALDRMIPSAILLDIMMPEEDGWEILLELQQHPVARQVPILICSVVNEPLLAESLGAAGYLTKPVSQEALLAALAPWQ
jgi:CheY-like chemotaxis protein